MISVIIPTFNESDNINTLIPYLRDCEKGYELEIIIADSPKTSDDTFELATKLGAVAVKCKNCGRAFQMNEGAKMANGEIYYFLHADARPPENFVTEILEKINSGCEFGIFSYRFDSQNFLLRCNAYFTRFDGVFAGGGDQSLFVKKSFFKSLNGFDEDRLIMEDFDMYRRAKKTGKKFCIVKNPLIVSARKYKHNSWWKVNFTNLQIFTLYAMKGSQEAMIRLNKKLSN